jgi:plastocyanin
LSFRFKAVFAAAVAVLAIPASASAATKVVNMGTPSKVAQTFNQKYGSDVNDFFPHGTTIHVGDSVSFVPVGFHDLTIPKKGGKAVPLFAPIGQVVAGANDAAGAAFWFNGQAKLGFNLPTLAPAGFGKKFTYTGAKAIHSGLPLGNKLKPVTVKFAKAGSYTYYCDVHPGMKGTVKVLAKSKAIPSAKADAKALAHQVARDLKEIKTLTKAAVPAGTVDVGSAGKYGTEYFGMLPATRTVPAGTTLTFQMTARSVETHTATFGPGDPEKEPNSYLGKLTATLESPVPDPSAIYPSDVPGTLASLTPTLHGNGFWNSGALDAVAATPLPRSNKVTFNTPGTYTYHCLIHPFMKGTVVVQ